MDPIVTSRNDRTLSRNAKRNLGFCLINDKLFPKVGNLPTHKNYAWKLCLLLNLQREF